MEKEITLIEENLEKNNRLSNDQLVFLFDYIEDLLLEKNSIESAFNPLFTLNETSVSAVSPELLEMSKVFFRNMNAYNRINYKNNDLEFVYKVIKDFWHVKQFSDIQKDTIKKEFNENNYDNFKSFLICNNDPAFYIENREFMHSELDAALKTNRFIIKNINRPIIKTFEPYVSQLLQEIREKEVKINALSSDAIDDYFFANKLTSQIYEKFLTIEYSLEDNRNSIKELISIFSKTKENDIDFYSYLTYKLINNLNPYEYDEILDRMNYNEIKSLKLILKNSEIKILKCQKAFPNNQVNEIKLNHMQDYIDSFSKKKK